LNGAGLGNESRCEEKYLGEVLLEELKLKEQKKSILSGCFSHNCMTLLSPLPTNLT
jgi:hypothetical protein